MTTRLMNSTTKHQDEPLKGSSQFAGSSRSPKTKSLSRCAVADNRSSVIARRLSALGDLCVVVAVLVVPMTSACLQDLGVAIFVACSLLLGLSWAAQQIMNPSDGSGVSGAEFIILGAIGLICLQMVPLPASALAGLAPFSQDYLTLWGTPDGQVLGSTPWQTISLTPALTRSGLVLLIAYALFFLTLVQKLRTTEDIHRVMRLIAFAIAAMAVLGVLQLAFGNGKFLWIFEHPTRTAARPARAAFSNPNHFAHFLALGIGPLVWWWHQAAQQDQGRVMRGSLRTRGFTLSNSLEEQKWYLGAAIALVLLAGVLSESRGGVCAIAVAVLISVRMIRKDWQYLVRLGIPIVVLVSGAIWLFGTELLEMKFQSVLEARSVKELFAGRFSLWTALVAALPSFWVAGSGLGSHAEVYPTWLAGDPGVRFSHAESGYLQLLLELGLPGFVLLLCGLGLILRWAWQTWRPGDTTTKMTVTALTAGLVASSLHSLVDFAWYIPGCMIVTLVLAACLCRCHQLNQLPETDASCLEFRSRMWPQSLAWLIIVLIVPLGKLSATVVIQDAESEHDWSMYRRYSTVAADNMTYDSLDALDACLDAIILHLERCIKINPSDCRAASDLSAMYLRRFERYQANAGNQMSIREIRDTVRTSGFESNKEIAQWLNRAFGHGATDLYRAVATAQKGIQGQPMRGETYLVLAQAGFIVGMTEQEEDSLIQQALRLRPNKAEVLYVAGLKSFEDGDIDAASSFWQRAFFNSPGIRPSLVKSLVSYFSAVEFIERIQPGPDGLRLMFHEYGRADKQADQTTVAEHYCENFEQYRNDTTVSSSRFFWAHSFALLDYCGQHELALESLANAVRQEPHHYQLRKQFALQLLARKMEEEALAQLEWCQIRMPDDTQIAHAVKQLKMACGGGKK